MPKTNILLIVGIGILILAIGGGTLLLSKSNVKIEEPSQLLNAPQLIKESFEEVKADEIYEDPAGFSFGIPKSAKTSDVTGDENDVYSEVEIEFKGKTHKLSARDTKYTKLADWYRSDARSPKTAELTGATKLAGVGANQYKGGGNLYTVAIDMGVVYLLVSPDSESDLHNLIINSFKFADQEVTSGDAGIIYEEEEVVE